MLNESGPLTLNPFLNLLLVQFLEYATTHAQEIIDMIVKLLKGEPKAEFMQAAAAFRLTPNEETLNALVDHAVATGDVTPAAVATKLINSTMIK